MVNVLYEHDEFQWEDTDETERAYDTDEANHVYRVAFVGCTYHCD